MGNFTINTSYLQEVTVISNIFLDDYMLEANGEFVKIYLYLLRATCKEDASFSLSSIADTLNCTEKDILRALKYWKKAGVLDLIFDEQRSLSGISFLPLTPVQQKEAKEPDLTAAIDAPVLEKPPCISNEKPIKKSADTAVPLTPQRMMKLKENEDIVQLLFIASQYLGKTLTSTETASILYFYEELHFSVDLIEYLIEYCVSRGSSSIRYMETVATAWAKQGITTVAMAKRETSSYNKQYYTIMKALGIKSRSPIDAEIAYMDTWLNEYSFSMDIINEACTRTVMQANPPSFKYAESILSRWYHKGVRHLKDIELLDDKHKMNRITRELPERDRIAPALKSVSNKFNNFHQREYDYVELEKQLLNK